MTSRLRKRIIRDKVRREVLGRRETMDAILWDILTDRLCRVKVLGSNTLLVARYNENLEQKPAWMKPGNAVKLLHTSGNRHLLEIVGSGQAIPNPTGAAMLPTAEAGEDTVLQVESVTLPSGTSVTNDYTSSLMVYPFETACMKVWVAVGVFRIDGVIYAAETMTLSESNIADLSCGAPIEEIHAAATIGAAHATLYRIDSIVIGADGVVDVVAGTEAATPVAPDTPTSHVLCATVLIPPGATALYGWQINKAFTPAIPVLLTVSVADGDLAYAQHSTTITVSVDDQYGNDYKLASVSMLAEIESGTGFIDGGTSSTQTTPSGSNSVTFTYSRDLETYTYTEDPEDPAESSPVIAISLIQNPNIISKTYIILRDSTGALLP